MRFRSFALVLVVLVAWLWPAPVFAFDAPPAHAALRTAHLEGLPPGHHPALSAVTLAPLPFSLLGLALPPDSAAEVRTSWDGRGWSVWRALEPAPDEGPDEGADDGAGDDEGSGDTAPLHTAPLWVGAARHLQVRTQGVAVDRVHVELIDSAGLSRSLAQRVLDGARSAWRGRPQAALATAGAPPIVSRAEWGADESLNRDSPAYAPAVRMGFLHHTAGSNDYGPGDVPAILRGIHAYHVEGQGWDDIGYNLLIDRFGTVYEGRAGGLEAAVIGAHAGGFNTGAFGISAIGDFTRAQPSPELLDGLAQVLAWKYDVHHVDVTGALRVTSRGSSRYEEGVEVALQTLAVHRDVSTTSCPATLEGHVGALRERIVELQGPVVLGPVATPSQVRVVAGRSIDGAVAVGARLRPEGPWRLEITDPQGLVVHADQGSGEAFTSTWIPDAAAAGSYTATVSSAGRRPAASRLSLVPPVIDQPQATPSDVLQLRDGTLAESIRFAATLWTGAAWALQVHDPAGALVFDAQGRGATAEATWDGPAPAEGAYGWTLSAEGAEPVRGRVTVSQESLQRIGDQGDVVADAVDVSATAFPDPLSAARAVVVRDDVFADAMTGGPLAGAQGPVLLTGSGGLDDRVRRELERVLPPGAPVYVLGGRQAVDEGVVTALEQRWTVQRLAGQERSATAARVARAVVERTGATSALVARAGPDEAAPWADALAAGAYGADRGVPVLLTDSGTLSEPARQAVAELGLTDTVVLGGALAVSDAVLAALPRPVRVAGENRAGTAAAVAVQLWGRSVGARGDRLVLADLSGSSAWTLALAAAPLAAGADAPLYAGAAGALPVETRDALVSLGYGPDRVAGGWVLGSAEAVGPQVVDAAGALLR